MPLIDDSIQPEVSVIVPARNEEAVLGVCLRSLAGQSSESDHPSSHPFPTEGKGWGTQDSGSPIGKDPHKPKDGLCGAPDRSPEFEVIVVDDHSTDRTWEIAEGFPVAVIEADALPE